MSEIEKITSRDNQRLVNARKVRGGNGGNLIFIEGRRLVEEALRSDIVIDECFYVDGCRNRELLSGIAAKTSKIFEIPERIFRTIADTNNPQGTILLGQRPSRGLRIIEERMGAQPTMLPVVLFLNEIGNPANLGAILRTAEAAGVVGVVVSENSADAFSPNGATCSIGGVPLSITAAFINASGTTPVWLRRLLPRSSACVISATPGTPGTPLAPLLAPVPVLAPVPGASTAAATDAKIKMKITNGMDCLIVVSTRFSRQRHAHSTRICEIAQKRNPIFSCAAKSIKRVFEKSVAPYFGGTGARLGKNAGWKPAPQK